MDEETCRIELEQTAFLVPDPEPDPPPPSPPRSISRSELDTFVSEAILAHPDFSRTEVNRTVIERAQAVNLSGADWDSVDAARLRSPHKRKPGRPSRKIIKLVARLQIFTASFRAGLRKK